MSQRLYKVLDRALLVRYIKGGLWVWHGGDWVVRYMSTGAKLERFRLSSKNLTYSDVEKQLENFLNTRIYDFFKNM